MLGQGLVLNSLSAMTYGTKNIDNGRLRTIRIAWVDHADVAPRWIGQIPHCNGHKSKLRISAAQPDAQSCATHHAQSVLHNLILHNHSVDSEAASACTCRGMIRDFTP